MCGCLCYENNTGSVFPLGNPLKPHNRKKRGHKHKEMTHILKSHRIRKTLKRHRCAEVQQYSSAKVLPVTVATGQCKVLCQADTLITYIPWLAIWTKRCRWWTFLISGDWQPKDTGCLVNWKFQNVGSLRTYICVFVAHSIGLMFHACKCLASQITSNWSKEHPLESFFL